MMNNLLVIVFYSIIISYSDSKRSVNTVTSSFLWPKTNSQFQRLVPQPDPQKDKVVQVSILLPSKTKFSTELEPAQKRSGAGILVGFESADKQGLLGDLHFNLTFRDTQCDNIYGPKSFTDAIVEGVHVLFGPSCEYALGKNSFYTPRHYIKIDDGKLVQYKPTQCGN